MKPIKIPFLCEIISFHFIFLFYPVSVSNNIHLCLKSRDSANLHNSPLFANVLTSLWPRQDTWNTLWVLSKWTICCFIPPPPFVTTISALAKRRKKNRSFEILLAASAGLRNDLQSIHRASSVCVEPSVIKECYSVGRTEVKFVPLTQGIFQEGGV